MLKYGVGVVETPRRTMFSGYGMRKALQDIVDAPVDYDDPQIYIDAIKAVAQAALNKT